MQFFKVMDEQEISTVTRRGYMEARIASKMRIILSVVASVAYGVLWHISGDYNNPLLWVLALIVFYWIWYQWLPRFEKRWEYEEKQKELSFIEFLYKYIDAAGLEKMLKNLSQRVAELERQTKQFEKSEEDN